MDPSIFRAKGVKIGGTTKVEAIKLAHLDKKYKFKLFPNTPATESGLVKVMELIPESSEMPNFILRWDEKSDTLDVDIYKNGKLCNELWGIEEYNGHHTQKIGNRRFGVKITIPNKKIFEGIIDVGLLIQAKISIKLTSHVKLKAEVIRKRD
jgi:hypothetical protein